MMKFLGGDSALVRVQPCCAVRNTSLAYCCADEG
jgi:hypothetical protein